ncbi:MAG: PEP-CTERM sorting domain-containing protein [Akkermansiaceae bacterium]|nr:PEP-CTERM sorting domain-containing protein [Akkermansiaceae bacterium]
MKTTLGIIGAALCASTLSSQAVVLVQYNFDDDATHKIPDVLATHLSAGGPTSPDFDDSVTSEANLFTSEGQGVENGTADNMSAAWTSGQYWEFSITADSGFTFDLDTLTFDIGKSANGTNDWAIRTSVDAFAADVEYRNQGTLGTATTQTVNFNTFADTGMSGTSGGGEGTFTAGQFDGLSTIMIRIAYDDRQNDTDSASATRLDNWTVNGSVNAVPEPSITALLGLGGLVLLLRRRR